MARRKLGHRVLGPYKHRDGWRIVEVNPGATPERSRATFPSRAQAELEKRKREGEIVSADQTTDTAIEAYEKHLTAKGNKAGSVARTRWSLLRFFPEPLPLWGLNRRTCEGLYRALSEGDEALAVDSHRNALAETKTFLNWCCERGWLGSNPAAHIKGIGRRRKRKPQLRLKDMRKWYAVAVDLADGGDEGAVAALMALLLGMRASEICERRVRDLDEDEHPCDLLVIDEGKTDESARTIEVPEPLRGFLSAQIEAKPDSGYLFPADSSRHGHHERGWVRASVHRICDQAKVERVTAHGMRGALGTLALDRGTAGHAVAATLGHADIKTTIDSYAQPGSAAVGVRRRGMKVLSGGKK